MKQSKLRGYIYNFEHKNKKFSFNKTIKILDVSNTIYLDLINKSEVQKITSYNKSKYMYKEIVNELKFVYNMLEDGNVLMAICLLRNTYEEIMYVMATSLQIELDINVQTKAGYFKDIVCDNVKELLSDNFEKEDIKDLYSYLSKITHVTNIKEAISYLINNTNIKKYIINEIKYILITIESIYLDFINKKSNANNDMNKNILLESTYVELINTLYYVANVSKKENQLEIYFYGDKNQKYIKEQNELIINAINDMKSSKNDIQKFINAITKELNIQLKETGYMELANKILNENQRNHPED